MYGSEFTAFCRKYESEEACESALCAAKWPDGFRCPRCGNSEAYVTCSRRLPLYQCKSCRHQTSATAGTVLEGSRIPLRLWLLAIYLHSQPWAIPATRLSEILGVTYKTAWLLGHKLRHAMGSADCRELLSGIVRVNVGLYIRTRTPLFRQKSADQSLLVGASVNDIGDPLTIKIKKVPEEHVRYGSVLPTGVRAFAGEHIAPVTSDLLCVPQLGSRDSIRPLVNIKIEAGRWLNAGFWGGIGPKHLDAYLHHYCFLWNLKLQKQPAFERLFHLSAAMRTVIYPVLIGKRLAQAAPLRSPRRRYPLLAKTG